MKNTQRKRYNTRNGFYFLSRSSLLEVVDCNPAFTLSGAGECNASAGISHASFGTFSM